MHKFFFVWHDSFIHTTWLVFDKKNAHFLRHYDQPRAIWFIYICGMTPSFVWRDPFICVTWLIHICDRTSQSSFKGTTWRVNVWDFTHLHYRYEVTNQCVGLYSFAHVKWLICDISHQMTHMWHLSNNTYVTYVTFDTYVTLVIKWHIYDICDISHIWHVQYVTLVIKWHICDISHICQMTHMWHMLHLKHMWH